MYKVLFIFVLQLTLAGVMAHAEEDWEKELQQDFAELDKSVLADWKKIKKERGEEPVEVKKKIVVRSDSQIDEMSRDNSKIMKAEMLPGAYIYGLDDKDYRLTRRIYVGLVPRDLNRNLYYIVNKKGVPKYWVHGANLVFVDHDTELAPHPPRLESYAPPSDVYESDRDFVLLNNTHYEQEYLNVQYWADTFNRPGNSEATARRFENATFARTHFPLDVGLVVSYQKGLWESDKLKGNNAMTWNALYVGPALQYPIAMSPALTLYPVVSFQKSLRMSGNYHAEDYSFDANVLSFEVQAAFDVKLGKILLGTTYRRTSMSIDSAPEDFGERSSNRQNMVSLGVYLGYGFELHL